MDKITKKHFTLVTYHLEKARENMNMINEEFAIGIAQVQEHIINEIIKQEMFK